MELLDINLGTGPGQHRAIKTDFCQGCLRNYCTCCVCNSYLSQVPGHQEQSSKTPAWHMELLTKRPDTGCKEGKDRKNLTSKFILEMDWGGDLCVPLWQSSLDIHRAPTNTICLCKLIFLKPLGRVKNFGGKENIPFFCTVLEHDASNTKGMGLIPIGAVDLGLGFSDPPGSLPNQNSLWF